MVILIEHYPTLDHPGYCGFRGSGFNGASYEVKVVVYTVHDICILLTQENVNTAYNYSHIAMTYTALATLITLGDDLSKVNKPAIVKSLKELQLDKGRCVGSARILHE